MDPLRHSHTKDGWPVRGKGLAVLILLMCCPSWALAGKPLAASCYQFNRYGAERLFHGPYAKPDIHSSRAVHHYRTVIREQAEGGPNFAGYLRVVMWGCGSNCQEYAFINQKTGYTYRFPIASELGVRYKANSRLFIVNPPEEGGDDPLNAFNKPRSFVWDKKTESLRLLPNCNGNAKH